MLYEIKKIFSRTGGKTALAILAILLFVVCFFACDVTYVDSEGNSTYGILAAAKLRREKKAWAGVLDEQRLEEVIAELNRIESLPEAQSDDIVDSNITYSRKQGLYNIRNLLNHSFANSFREYDYYRADSLLPEQAADFYTNRTKLLQEWLEGDAAYYYSDEEKQFLLTHYEQLNTPLTYDYSDGWEQLFEFLPSIVMILTLIIGFLVSGIFSSEYTLKADSLLFSAYHGRDRAVSAKIKAGLCIITALYWSLILLYSAIILLIMGGDGASCPIQILLSGWKCLFNLTIWQVYLICVFTGYLGCLFLSLLAMYVSAKTRSTVLAALVPFILIFLPSFLSGIDNAAVSKLLGLLPDRLLDMPTTLIAFTLYQLGKTVLHSISLLIPLYLLLVLVLPFFIYKTYRHISR